MSDRNAMLDICDVAGDGGNLWFVIALLGAIGLNLVLTCVLGACMLRGRGGGKAKGDEEAFDDVQGSVAKGALFDAGGGGSGGGGGGADLKRELLLFKRQLDAMDKKIDNKRVNEITASYLLHNAHDAIGNHVPTAAQVPCCRARLATRAANPPKHPTRYTRVAFARLSSYVPRLLHPPGTARPPPAQL